MGTSLTMAGDEAPKTVVQSRPDKYPEVLFYYANILDYCRLLFLWFAVLREGVVYSTLQPLCGSDGMYFAVMYTISMGLDAFDGMLARAFDQCSKFGYYADMVIDRISSITALLWSPSSARPRPPLRQCGHTVLLLLLGVCRTAVSWRG